MAEFDAAYRETMANEGGYSNDPLDRGGETYRGISRRNWPGWEGWEIVDALKKKPGFPGTLKANAKLQELVKKFYRFNFWTPFLDQMPQPVANWLFDKGVNMGIRQANKLLQRAVGVEPDGMIGPKTLAAIKSENPNNLVSRCRDEAKRFYRSLVAQDQSQERFLKGWLARA